MLKLKDGTTLQDTLMGFLLKKGKRSLYIIAKSANQGIKAREIIAKNSFNKLFNKGIKNNLLGNNIRNIIIN